MEQASVIETLRDVVRDLYGNEDENIRCSGVSGFARAIGKPQSSVHEVLAGVRKNVPAGWCLLIERATSGRVTRQQLRPDVWPAEEVGQ